MKSLKQFFKDINFIFKKAKTLEDKKLKAAFWYGFRNPFREISNEELNSYLKNIKV